ncbi:cytochrome c-type biogenesis protein CcmH [Rhodospirillaceae bacterium KN72]|uniref:Cytochrome c-type biogenesis protein n=1 Tax=Pacificispira spongiicola TaxID=2729598 RepID=A0A7Y0E0F2_9PROT|nr:cytochrome c-type biogenesis protein [Pacificispira spongiicola]NMM44952.1 cytochrome c-type biogenesis protein CcmH [Pacificispira spongiicola]
MIRFTAAVTGLILLALTGPAQAVLPDEKLSDPALEARARVISQDIRCLVCQNQSIDDSNADLARDLRIIVRERLLAGDTNQEVKDYLTARYGDYVLLSPPMNLETVLLWSGPFVLVAIGLISIGLWYRGRRAQMAEAGGTLTDDERRRIETLLSQAGGDDDGNNRTSGDEGRAS